MITVTKTIQIQPGVNNSGPYSYVWTINTPASSCVSMSNTSGTIVDPATENITNTFTFFNETCLNDTTVSVTVTYNEGKCSTTIDVPITNPCSSISLGTISHSSPYVFTIAVTGGTAPYTYNWVYDTSLFNDTSAEQNAETLTLTPINSANPTTDFVIGVNVTDANGCQRYTQRQIITCAPSVPTEVVQLQCVSGGDRVGNICIVPDVCPNTTIDWTTFTLTSHIPNFSVTDLGDSCGDGRLFRITANSNVTGNTSYNLTYTVTDSYGATSNEGTLHVSVPNCSSTEPITILNSPPVQIDCSYSAGSTYYIGPMDDYVVSDNPVDWSTLLFIDTSTGATTAGPFTTAGGATVTFNQTTLKFEYVIPAGATSDFFQWTVCDNQGNCAVSTLATIILVCPPMPTAVNDTLCGTCGVEEEHSVIANDTINGQLVELTITSAPTYGTAVFNGDLTNPKVLYTALSGYAGSDSYQYQIKNDSGQTDTATVTVTVQCAGQDTNITICE